MRLRNFNGYKMFESSISVFFLFSFFILKFPFYEKLVMTSQFDLIQFWTLQFVTQFFKSVLLLGNSRSLIKLLNRKEN